MRATFFSLILISILISGTLISNRAHAGGYLRGGGMYLMQKEGTDAADTRTLIDFGAGYVFDKGWTFGGTYGLENETGSSAKSRSSIGPTAGWVSQKEFGPYFLASYYPSSTLSSGYSGTGYQGDIGYKIDVTRLALALQLSYEHYTYPKLNGAKISPSLSESYVNPYLMVWIDFQ